MTKILLIRHGESEANRRGIFAGQINPELEENGIRQAEMTACFIAENFSVDAIYASDLSRALKTAECLGKVLNLPVMKEPGMREINGGKWEGVLFSDLCILYKEDFDLWQEDVGRARCTGGESVWELGDRVMKTLTTIAEENEGKTVAIATHATPIRVMQSLVKTGSVEMMHTVPWVSNASVTVLDYENGVWTLVAEGLDDHLKNIRTALPDHV